MGTYGFNLLLPFCICMYIFYFKMVGIVVEMMTWWEIVVVFVCLYVHYYIIF